MTQVDQHGGRRGCAPSALTCHLAFLWARWRVKTGGWVFVTLRSGLTLRHSVTPCAVMCLDKAWRLESHWHVVGSRTVLTC